MVGVLNGNVCASESGARLPFFRTFGVPNRVIPLYMCCPLLGGWVVNISISCFPYRRYFVYNNGRFSMLSVCTCVNYYCSLYSSDKGVQNKSLFHITLTVRVDALLVELESKVQRLGRNIQQFTKIS